MVNIVAMLVLLVLLSILLLLELLLSLLLGLVELSLLLELLAVLLLVELGLRRLLGLAQLYGLPLHEVRLGGDREGLGVGVAGGRVGPRLVVSGRAGLVLLLKLFTGLELRNMELITL